MATEGTPKMFWSLFGHFLHFWPDRPHPIKKLTMAVVPAASDHATRPPPITDHSSFIPPYSLSSLPLQVLLHLHAHLLPFSLASQIGCFVLKFSVLHPTYRVILLAVHLISVLVHIARPILGYQGNLGERIPALSGFWILSALLHLPILLFLGLNPDLYPLPLERFTYLLDCALSAAELVISTFLIRRLANRQMERFRMAVLEREERKKKEENEGDQRKAE